MLKKTTLVVTGLNALAALPVITPASAPALHAPTASPVSAINQASLIAIEKSWLALPRLCKARGAAFDPVVVGKEELPSDIANLYAQTVV